MCVVSRAAGDPCLSAARQWCVVLQPESPLNSAGPISRKQRASQHCQQQKRPTTPPRNRCWFPDDSNDKPSEASMSMRLHRKKFLRISARKRGSLSLAGFLHQLVELPCGVKVSDGHVLKDLPAQEFPHFRS